jgi:glycerol kinase
MAPAIPAAGRDAPLRVDGGLTGSAVLVQRLADLLGRPVDVAADSESTALGTALLAAIGAGRLDERDAAAVAATARSAEPTLDEPARATERAAWRDFVSRAIALSPRDAGFAGAADH